MSQRSNRSRRSGTTSTDTVLDDSGILHEPLLGTTFLRFVQLPGSDLDTIMLEGAQ